MQYAFRALASAENTFSSNTFGTINVAHYYIGQDASIIIEYQQFSNTKIKATSGNNEVTIQNSGNINVGGTVYDTNSMPFKKTLNSQTITVNSVVG